MTDPLCIRCARPLADGSYCCDRCAAQAAQKLAEIAEVAPAARDTANGLSRSSQGGATGKPGSRLPLDLTAMAKLDGVQNTLTGWARLVAEERGRGIPVAYAPDDQVVRCANWLTEQVEWIRHRDFADEFLTDVEACRRIVRGIVRGPADQRYLGPCGAVRSCEGLVVGDWPEADCGNHVVHEPHEQPPCDGDVYVRGDARTGRCKTCGAEVDRGDWEAWLDEQVSASDLAWTAKGIADAYSMNAKTIRSWATERRAENGVVLRRPKLATYWHNGTRLVPWVEPRPGEDVKARGDRLHYVADVVRLAKEAAAERERRMAARAAESETAA